MDDAISCVEYLQAAFPLEGELVLSEATAQQLLEAPPTAPTTLEASIFLKLEEPPQEEPLQVDVSLPTTSDAGPPSLSLRQPSYFTRAQHHELCQSLSPVASVDDLYMVLEEIKPAAAHILQAAAKQHQATAALKAQRASPQFTGPLVRAWFWFITISTREKRGHMTQWGPQYGLSGFLLAGKPGILCLEGRTDAIDACACSFSKSCFKSSHFIPLSFRFWKEIKTSSWAEVS